VWSIKEEERWRSKGLSAGWQLEGESGEERAEDYLKERKGERARGGEGMAERQRLREGGGGAEPQPFGGLLTEIFSTCQTIEVCGACSDTKSNAMKPEFPVTRRTRFERDIAYSVERGDYEGDGGSGSGSGSGDARSKGEDGGVGLVLEVKEIDFWGPSLVVGSIKPGGPCDMKGVMPGDTLLAINQVKAAGRTPDELISMIRGPAGSKVRLQFEKAGTHELNKVAQPPNITTVDVVRSSETARKDSKDKMVVLGTYIAPPNGAARSSTQHSKSVVLSAEEGEVVQVITHGARGWTTIEKSDKSIGWFPSSYLGPLDPNHARVNAKDILPVVKDYGAL
jgi:hypothetical protein